jgi:hypothetical protein
MPNATLRTPGKLNTLQVPVARGAYAADSTYSVPASTPVGHEIVFCRIPTSARINGVSRLLNDALGTSVTMSIGLKAVGGNFTTSNTAIAAATAVATAGSFTIPGDHANAGKMVWELLGLASDPGGFADVIGVTAGATTTASAQDVTLALVYTVD